MEHVGPRPDRPRPSVDQAITNLGRWGWHLIVLGVLVFYALTAGRAIQWQDYGQFVLRIVEGELFNELGLALAHPLHFWLGRAAVAVLPVEPAFAVALVSALAGAVTIANIFGVARTVTSALLPALAAAGLLMVANTFWRMSTMPECYTVTTALLSAELWCMALYFKSRRAAPSRGPDTHPTQASRAPLWLMGMMALNGLGLANHNMAMLTLPVSGLVLLHAWRRGDVRWRGFAAAMSVWFIGALPYLILIAIEAARAGDVGGAIRSALFGNTYSDNVLNARPGIKQLGISVAFTLLSFPGLALPLAAIGLVVARRWLADRAMAGLAWALYGALAIHALFVLRYNVVDQHTFLLPTYTVLSLFVGIGCAWAMRALSARGRRVLVAGVVLSIVAAPGVYVLTAKVARDRGALGSMARNKPYRDDYRYLFVPWGAGETSAKTMSELAVRLAGDDGVVLVGDSMARFAVGYQIQRRGLSEVTLQVLQEDTPADWSAYRGRVVVLVPASTDTPPIDPPAGWQWRAEGELYVLVADSGEGAGVRPRPAPPADDPTTP